MTDPYLFLTPVLALAVLALARFVGCDIVFGLERDPDASVVETFALGTPRMDFTGWAGMVIRVGANPLRVTQLGRIMLTQSTAEHQVKIVQRAGPTGGVDLGMVTIPPSAPTQGFAYAKLEMPVVLKANTDYYLVSSEVANGDVFHDLDTTVITTDVAQVLGRVFDFADDVPDAGYDSSLGVAGTTYGPVDFKYEA